VLKLLTVKTGIVTKYTHVPRTWTDTVVGPKEWKTWLLASKQPAPQCTQLASRLSNIATVTTGQKTIGSENRSLTS